MTLRRKLLISICCFSIVGILLCSFLISYKSNSSFIAFADDTVSLPTASIDSGASGYYGIPDTSFSFYSFTQSIDSSSYSSSLVTVGFSGLTFCNSVPGDPQSRATFSDSYTFRQTYFGPSSFAPSSFASWSSAGGGFGSNSWQYSFPTSSELNSVTFTTLGGGGWTFPASDVCIIRSYISTIHSYIYFFFSFGTAFDFSSYIGYSHTVSSTAPAGIDSSFTLNSVKPKLYDVYTLFDSSYRRCFLWTFSFLSISSLSVTPITYSTIGDWQNTSSYQTGYNDGWNAASTVGEQSYNQGYQAGLSVGHENGYSQGYTAGAAAANEYTFFGLISSVLSAPINAITGLLNFDILGVNMSSFFFSLLTFCIILKVASLFTGG